MQQNHIIHKQVAEITFGNKAEVQELFRKIGSLLNQQINNSTSRILDQIIPADTLIALDSLELDLGSLTYPINETEFTEKYETVLEQALLLKLEKLNTNNPNWEGTHNAREFKLTTAALLHHFLLKGTLPCWGGGESKNNPNKIFNTVLAKDSASLRTMLLKIGTHNNVRKRLVNQFSEQIIKDSIALIEPTQAHYIFAYHKDISTLQLREQLVKAESATFEKSLWHFILTYLLVEMSSQFERKMFVKSTLRQMASHYNLAYQEVLNLFAQVAQTHKHLIDNSLPSLVVELTNETPQSNESIKQDVRQPFLNQESTLTDDDALLHYIFYGSLPFHYQHYSASHIQFLLTNELKQHPDRIKQILNKHELSDQLSKQLSNILPDAILIELVNLKQPTQTNFIANYHTSVLSVQKKKNIVKTEESEFRKSLWQFIFAFLLNDRGSLFNTKAFVESNIRRLANHYNMGFTDLLLFLTQGIGEELVNINNSSNLFYVVSEILREQKLINGTSSFKKDDISDIPQTEESKIKQKIFTQNVLLFWLTQGYMPWWSNSSNAVDPFVLFTQFINSQPQEGLQLLQLALQKGISKTISLKTIEPQITTILQQAPEGENALARIKVMAQLSLPQNLSGLKEQILETVLAAVLDAYNEHHFSKFDHALFLTKFLYLLKSTMGAQQTEITKQIIVALKKNETAQAVSTANTLLKIVKTETALLSSSEKKQLEFQLFDEHELLIESHFQENPSAREQLDTAVNIVAYFLQHNRLPAKIQLNSEAKINYLLQRLMLLIYQLDATKLKNIIESTGNSALAQMRMHNVIAIENNQETRNVLSILAPCLERDTIRYINAIEASQTDSTQLNELFRWIDKKNDSTQRKKIYQAMMISPAIAQLVATQNTGEVFINILRNLTNNQNQEIVKNYAYLLGLAVSDSFEREKIQIHLREFSLNWFSGSSIAATSLFFQEFLKFLSQRKNWNMTRLQEQIASLLPKITDSKMVQLQPLAQQMHSNAIQYATNLEHKNKLLNTQQNQEHKLMKETLGSIAEPLLTKNTALKTDQMQNPFKLSEGEKIFVPNAGIVLIHPFMSTYLMRVGLTEAGKFISDEAQHRATHLLQYLVNNAVETPEQEMVLNKLLCGLPIEEPIVSGIEITELEKNTAHELLTAVIQNWEQMKNSSVEGLQGSFLQREGMLSENDEEWTLKIEQRTYDLLLQTLPWGLSMIKYPWMNKPLMVEWT